MTRDERLLLEEKYAGKEAPEYEKDRERLARGEPLAYVIGWQPFLGLTIHLDSKPLIPRPETEWWTEQLLQEIGAAKREAAGRKMGVGLGLAARSAPIFRPAAERPLRFLDLCAGSGAIGCTALKFFPYMEIFFGELDPAHETSIRKNIRENGLDEKRADIRIGDLFEPFSDMKFDIIAANPPYIPAGRALPESVIDYEPARALYAGRGGLAVICRIARELPAHLAKSGIAWIECDSSHAEKARALFRAQGLAAEIRTDQYQRPRVIVVSFPQ